jgi:hypothetical protein
VAWRKMKYKCAHTTGRCHCAAVAAAVVVVGAQQLMQQQHSGCCAKLHAAYINVTCDNHHSEKVNRISIGSSGNSRASCFAPAAQCEALHALYMSVFAFEDCVRCGAAPLSVPFLPCMLSPRTQKVRAIPRAGVESSLTAFPSPLQRPCRLCNQLHTQAPTTRCRQSSGSWGPRRRPRPPARAWPPAAWITSSAVSS